MKFLDNFFKGNKTSTNEQAPASTNNGFETTSQDHNPREQSHIPEANPQYNKAVDRLLNDLNEDSRHLYFKSAINLPTDIILGTPLDFRGNKVDHQQAKIDNVLLSPDTEYVNYRQDDIDQIQSRLDKSRTINDWGQDVNRFLHERDVSLNLGIVEFNLVKPSDKTRQESFNTSNKLHLNALNQNERG